MKGLTNEYLHALSKKLIGKEFLGVYPCDVIPKMKNNSTSFIIFNTGRSNTEGEHFVAIKVTKKNVFYFDSFGEPPSNKDISNFLLAIIGRKKFEYNISPIQDDSSNFCGFYCLAYLMSAKKKWSFKRFKNLFSIQNKKKNDSKVIKFIVRNIK